MKHCEAILLIKLILNVGRNMATYGYFLEALKRFLLIRSKFAGRS
jgi:hypothetical protein